MTCKACQKLAPKFRKLARDIESVDRSIIFAEMSSTLNKNFLKTTLKLEALPSIQIYAGEMLLDSFPCPPEEAAKLMQILKHWVIQVINANSKVTYTHRFWDSLPPPSSFLSTGSDLSPGLIEEGNMMSSQGKTEFLMSQVSGDSVFPKNVYTNSNSQRIEDSEIARNIMIASSLESEYFDATIDADIPLQLSDLFLLDDNEDEQI
jgi:hypothetical protein